MASFSEISDLPDSVLLAVLRLLPLHALVRSCGVCRRWRQLGRDPLLWRHLELQPFSAPALTVLLALAPCLRALKLDSRCDVSSRTPADRQLMADMASNDCAVKELELDLDYWAADADDLAVLVTLFVRRQVELGTMRRLRLNGPGPRIFSVLCEVGSAGLEHLHIGAALHFKPKEVMQALPPPSQGISATLRTLEYSRTNLESESGSDYEALRAAHRAGNPLLEQLIAAHAPTLESVEIEGEVPVAALQLLGRCAGLRRAQLLLSEPLSCLGSCPLLSELSLTMRDADDILDRMIGFFRGAAQLRKLSVRPVFLGQTVAALAALGSSGRPELRELELGFCKMGSILMNDPSGPPDPLALVKPLRGLPMLHTLGLDIVFQEAVLEAISVATPNLRVLRFFESHPCTGRQDGRCRLLELFRFAQRCPLLHVGVTRFEHSYCFKGKGCQCCRAGLHVPREDSRYGSDCVNLSAHPAVRCPLEQHREERCMCGDPDCQDFEWLLVSELTLLQ